MTQYKVLIIEDDLNAAQSISDFLSAWGFQCEYLKEFQQITEQFIRFKPEIVLFGASRAYNNHLFLRLFFAGLPVHSAMFAKLL